MNEAKNSCGDWAERRDSGGPRRERVCWHSCVCFEQHFHSFLFPFACNALSRNVMYCLLYEQPHRSLRWELSVYIQHYLVFPGFWYLSLQESLLHFSLTIPSPLKKDSTWICLFCTKEPKGRTSGTEESEATHNNWCPALPLPGTGQQWTSNPSSNTFLARVK